MPGFDDGFGNTIVIRRTILGKEGPEFIPEWPEPVDPQLNIGPLETTRVEEPIASEAKLVDTLTFNNPALFRVFRSWMGVSTSERTYPDSTVLEFAKWAAVNTKGFTLVVSDELARYNWAAENGWDSYSSRKRVKQLERDATERAHEFRRVFDDHSLPVGVVLWNRMHRKVVEESQSTLVEGEHLHWREWDRFSEASETPAFRVDLNAIHRAVAAKLVTRFTENGQPLEHVDHAMACYSLEEIFLSSLLARVGWANIKIGPTWEKPYDQVTAKYLAGHYDGKVKDYQPFAGAYLEC